MEKQVITENTDIIEISFSKAEREILNKLDTPSYNGKRSEYITKKILQKLGYTVKSVRDKYKNMHYGDLYIEEKNKYVEVKTGTVYNDRYKMCIDSKYTVKHSEGTRVYKQPFGLSYAWLYSKYEVESIVFNEFIVLVLEPIKLHQTIIDSIILRKNISTMKYRYPPYNDLNKEWFKARRNFYITENVEGSIKDSNNIYDTFLANVNLIPFCIDNKIKIQVIHYKIK